MNYTVKKHKLGYYYVHPLPSEEELSLYYKGKYYQENKVVTYSSTYSSIELEILSIDAKISDYIFSKKYKIKTKNLLDIACGEGFFIKNMYDLKWNVKGADYSSFGLKNHNPHFLEKAIYGDLYSILDNLIDNNEKFNFINLGNILEHVLDPIRLLNKCYQLLDNKSYLRVKVPNDFSTFQEFLINKYKIKKYWLCPLDHLSYFNFESLEEILKYCNLKVDLMHGDFPIEFFLQHPMSNYIEKKVGNKAHISRLNYTKMIWDQGVEKYLKTFIGLANSKIFVFS